MRSQVGDRGARSRTGTLLFILGAGLTSAGVATASAAQAPHVPVPPEAGLAQVVAPSEPGAGGPRHDKAYWRAIVRNDFAVPAGQSPLALLLDLSRGLGSPDPELRDSFGYDIPAAWIVRDGLLAPADLRVLLGVWKANLRAGIGEKGTDSVLLRSFSALDLSLVAAAEDRRPFLGEGEFRDLLDAALAYLAAEKDVRGFVPGTGWHHSVAHTADLLKFLARSGRLTRADQGRILDAIEAKLGAAGQVFVWGEDDRLAAAVLSIVKRPDLDRAALEAWTGRLAASWAALWRDPSSLDPARYAAAQNGRNVLRSLFVQVSASPPFAARDAVRDALLVTLKGM